MNRIRAATRFVAIEFGPLIVFWLLLATFGIKPAIAGSLVVIIADAIWRRMQGLAFTRLYLLSSGLTLVFGAIDLLSVKPFMLQYESVVTNIAVGIAFIIGAYGEKPLIQEAAEQREGAFPDTAEVRRFFQLFTLFWAAYFFVKATFYLWTATTMPLTQAMAVRSVVGGASLAAMIALSATQGRRLFFLCRRLGLLPPPEEPPQDAAEHEVSAVRAAAGRSS
jgi:intracellular septation protein A